MQDPFVGTWILNHARSEFDPNHRPASGVMHWQLDPEGYRMQAEGTTGEGKAIKEVPQHFIVDGQARPVPGAPGVTMVASMPDPHTVLAQGLKDGQILGQATYVVSADGRSLTASASGLDSAERRFATKVVFDRQ
jgi:hypothetical protein